MNKQERLKTELKKLKEAFAAITTLWHEETEMCDKLLEPDYPFAMSFDELSSEVNNWVEGIIPSDNSVEKETCPACFGCGYEDGGGDYEDETCPVCVGEGKVKKYE